MPADAENGRNCLLGQRNNDSLREITPKVVCQQIFFYRYYEV